jgi:hypothetical protein
VSEGDLAQTNLEANVEKAQAVKQAHEAELLKMANVVGIGVGLCMRGGNPTDEVGLIVLVRRKLPASQLDPKDIIPSQIKSVPVDVQEVGEIRPLQRPH